MLDVARGGGLRASAVRSYAALRSAALWGAVFAASPPFVRDRLLADGDYLFKLITEVALDLGGGVYWETLLWVDQQARSFWAEAEFFVFDTLVGVVLDFAMVTCLAPRAVLGKGPAAPGRLAALLSAGPGPCKAAAEALTALPASFAQRALPGQAFTVGQRLGAVGWAGVQYALAGAAMGFAGQSLANLVCAARPVVAGAQGEHGDTSADPALPGGVQLPPIARTCLIWGFFSGTSSNLRMQAVVGLERLLASSSLAASVPAANRAGSILLRLTNNVVGGEQFVDVQRLFSGEE